MSRVAEYYLSQKVYVSGIADRKAIKETVEAMGGEVVTSIKKATALMCGDFNHDMKHFGVKDNPMDAIDYVIDHGIMPEHMIIHDCNYGF